MSPTEGDGPAGGLRLGVVRCAACGQQARRDARWCPRCGAPPPGPPGVVAAVARRRVRLRAAAATLLLVGAGVLTATQVTISGPAPGAASTDGSATASFGPGTNGRGSHTDGGARAGPGADGGTPADAVAPPAGTPAPATGGVTCTATGGSVPCVDWVARLGSSEDTTVELVEGRLLTVDPTGHLASHPAGSDQPVWERSGASPLVRHPGTAAGTVAVTDAAGSTFVELSSGRELGAFTGPVRAAAVDDPWLLVDDGATLTSRGLVGEPGWSRPIPADGRAWVSTDGALLVTADGVLTAPYANTGTDRWQVGLTGTVVDAVRVGAGAVATTEAPPTAVVVAGDGDTEVHPLPAPAAELLLAPSGDAVVAVGPKRGDDTFVEVFDTGTRARRAGLRIAAPADVDVAPAIDDDHLLLAVDDGLRVIRLVDGFAWAPAGGGPGTVGLVALAEGRFAVLDRTGVDVRERSRGTLLGRVELGALAGDGPVTLVSTEPFLVRAGGVVIGIAPEVLPAT